MVSEQSLARRLTGFQINPKHFKLRYYTMTVIRQRMAGQATGCQLSLILRLSLLMEERMSVNKMVQPKSAMKADGSMPYFSVPFSDENLNDSLFKEGGVTIIPALKEKHLFCSSAKTQENLGAWL